MKKLWKRALSAILSAGMILSLLPGVTLAAEAEPVYEYVEVTEAGGLTSGGVYAIAAPNSVHSVLYHTHDGEMEADQVNAGGITGDRLTLDTGYPKNNQLWTLTGNNTNGYSVKSCAQDDTHYLHIEGTTLAGSQRVPVKAEEMPLTFQKVEGGWTISRVIDTTTYYLSHGDSDQYYVSTNTQTLFKLYKQTEVVLDAPTLPGYELVTSTENLTTDRYYMFVGKGAGETLYALLPGDGTAAPNNPQPGLTAKLTVSGNSVTAADLEGTAISDIQNLHFRAFRYSGGKDTFASAKKTGLLLSLRDTMFTNVADSMEVDINAGRVSLHSKSGRYLGLNIENDPSSAFQDEPTGFFGPTANTGCPIYLFAKSGEENKVPDIDLSIPGYKQVTSTSQLDIGPKYMIVSIDSYGDFYALCPNQNALNMLPGDSIDPSKGHANYASVTAQLTVDRAAGSTTAQRLTEEGTPEAGNLDKDKLHFTVERTGNTFHIKYGENLYLAMVDKHFFTETPTELSITPDRNQVTSAYPAAGRFLIKDLHSGGNNARILDFNLTGDPIQFVSDKGTAYRTNFWGPRFKRYPIYIYEYEGVPTTEKAKLDAVVKAQPTRNGDDYTPRSWEDFVLALKAAQALLQEVSPNETACADARLALRNAEERLVLKSAVITPEAPSGTTQKQPFPTGEVGGSKNFRIPGLFTLSDGTLAATIDARWDHTADAKGIDTVFSYSTDNGETWRFSFPNFFADSVNVKNSQSDYAAAFIDPAVVAKGNDVYILADLFPGGTALSAAPRKPDDANGFGANGKLLVYDKNIDEGQEDNNYTYYVGEFVDGYADLLNKSDNQSSLYYVDQYYNLYRRAKVANAAKDPTNDKLHCRQWDGDDPYGANYVQQNLFFYHSSLHVRNATYLWLIKGTYDPTAKTFTWSTPAILNPQVRQAGDGRFYGVGPGRGTVVSKNGTDTIVLPAYTNPTERSSVITSADGVTWARRANIPQESSEAAPVAVGDTLYLFTRHNNNYYVSTDNGANWTKKATGASYNAGCQLSAIHYSKKIDGKEAILLSAPATAGSRTNGKLFVFLVGDNGDLTLKCEYQVNGPSDNYGYSCLTELADGSIGLLYEDTGTHVPFVIIPITKIVQTGSIGDELYIHVPYFGQTTVTMESEAAANALAAAIGADAIVSATASGATVTFQGLKVGTLELTLEGGKKVHITVDDSHLTEQSITLRPGESKTLEVALGSTLLSPGDAAVAEAAVKNEPLPAAQGLTGTDAAFRGEAVDLSQALYTFTKKANGAYTVQSVAKPKLYLNIAGAAHSHRPGSTTAAEITLEDAGTAGSFYIKDTKYLYFYRNGTNRFDRNGSVVSQCSMLLYRPAGENEPASAELPGYVQVTSSAADVTNGQYLIAAKVGNDYYALNPSTGSNDYNYVLKVNSEKTVLTFTGEAVGRTDVVVGNVLYHVTVASPSSGGGAAGTSTYPITVETARGGALRADRASAPKGATVKLTITPDAGYALASLTVTGPEGKAVETTPNSDGTYTFPMPAGAVTVAAVFKPDPGPGSHGGCPRDASCPIAPFSDASPAAWYHDGVHYCLEKELMIGTSAHTFAPHAPTSRAMVATILWRLQGTPVVNYLMPYDDVDQAAWYAEAVRWASAEGVVLGYGNGSFGPGDPITREQLAAMLYRYQGKFGDGGFPGAWTFPAGFADRELVSDWADEAMAWMTTHGLLQGRGEGLLDPRGHATRAETATLFMRYLTR